MTGQGFCAYESAKPLFPISRVSSPSVILYSTYGNTLPKININDY